MVCSTCPAPRLARRACARTRGRGPRRSWRSAGAASEDSGINVVIPLDRPFRRDRRLEELLSVRGAPAAKIPVAATGRAREPTPTDEGLVLSIGARGVLLEPDSSSRSTCPTTRRRWPVGQVVQLAGHEGAPPRRHRVLSPRGRPRADRDLRRRRAPRAPVPRAALTVRRSARRAGVGEAARERDPGDPRLGARLHRPQTTRAASSSSTRRRAKNLGYSRSECSGAVATPSCPALRDGCAGCCASCVVTARATPAAAARRRDTRRRLAVAGRGGRGAGL